MPENMIEGMDIGQLRHDCRHGRASGESILEARLSGTDDLVFDDLVVVLPDYTFGEGISPMARVMPADELDPASIADDEMAFPLPRGILLFPQPPLQMGVLGRRTERMAIEVFPEVGKAVFKMTSGGRKAIAVDRIA